ncbi:MAG: IclR family transcriptional regulator [Castellaniella sp.]|uniref:IclR family transcriptional regulator n=1 Tax=Castellaniella sp. TaxID=1955812 RepID=UPI002A35C49D|nr:IclR family transcriptional regulator [Castellaniella sp.]MDY0309333.1 IclR family transcriptional regulator [Castellaniella sp.]
MSTDRIPAPAVARASAVLDLLARAGRPVTLAELARTLQLPKSSLHGLCATLEQLNLITRLEGGQMTLGPHVMMWANAFMARLDITQEFFASWDDMRILPEETITLSVRDGAEVVYIACRNGKHPLGLSFHAGMRLPAVYTATGLAMLSTLPDSSIRKLFGGTGHAWPEPLTAKGVRDAESLITELQRTRQRGYSLDHECVREGMYCYGAPVFDSRHPEAVAGVAVSIRSLEANPALEARAGQAIRKLADRLSERLGAWQGR